MNNKFKKIFGIDLGTTYSAIAYVNEYGKTTIVLNAENQRITPSVVFFDEDQIIVGEVAKENAKIYPNEIVTLIKRSMGDPYFLFEYQGKHYRPEEISSYILRKLVNDAKQHLNEDITDVVITCPAYFGINEREATRVAGEIAGLTVRQVLNEPTAAAIAYGMMENNDENVILVYDLGGGTFDITMFHAKPDAIEVICTGGDKELGGKDWDDRIIRYMVEQFQTETGTTDDILEDVDTWQELQLAAEKAKKTLSQRDKTPIMVTSRGERVRIELTREKFQEITSDLLERTISLTHNMLEDAQKKGYDKFDKFILVGGSARMPQIAARLKTEFPSVRPKQFAPDEAITKGAAIYGWKMSLNDVLIERVKEYSGEQDVDQINIPESIAQSVADETGFTLDAVKYSNIAIRNVTSKSFGVVARNEQNEDQVINLVLKNTRVPVQVTEQFGTHLKNQKTVKIRIMEDEVSSKNVSADDAIEIGTAILKIPSNLPANSPIQIVFRLNEEGRLSITAMETTQSREVSVSIETSSLIQGKELEEAMARSKTVSVS